MKLSDLARPPIQAHEVADPSKIQQCNCPYHGGLIARSYGKDEIGKVFYCPIGRQFYRFTNKWQGGFDSPLPYNHEAPV